MSGINVSRPSLLPAVLEGSFYGLLVGCFFALCIYIGWSLGSGEESPDRACAKNNERGSSAWVACVDLKVQERAQ